jgi:arylsulfatase A-like enzyme
MKAIMVMFDSLNRHMLSAYGSDRIKTPNFTRLAERTATFDNFYVGSMPCMPARRELHTGRLNFLHRSWGPVEPWDDSMPEMLKERGVHTHLATDHYHYFEDGGCTYHNRYTTWEFFRGQEGDAWKGEVEEPEEGYRIGRKNYLWRNDAVNRKYIQKMDDFPQNLCFNAGIEFIETNCEQDNWFLQIECFDPHEPFFAPKEFIDMYPDGYDGPFFDWPDYKKVDETPEQVEHLRNQYAALVSYCDYSLGRVLDIMDEKDLWKDTMLIVNTDHGFLLSEHDYWAKCIMPFYNEIAHVPFFLWDPRHKVAGERRQALAQTIDIVPTILEFFGVEPTKDMLGRSLESVVARDEKIHDAVLFGMHGTHVNVTDGHTVYMRAPKDSNNAPLYNYTLMPTRMERRYQLDHLTHPDLSLAEPFSFTKGCKTLKIPCPPLFETQKGVFCDPCSFGTLLFDVKKDPGQLNPLNDPELERNMIGHLARLLKENDAPVEQFERLGIEEA